MACSLCLNKRFTTFGQPDQTNTQTMSDQAPEILWFHGGGGTCKPRGILQGLFYQARNW